MISLQRRRKPLKWALFTLAFVLVTTLVTNLTPVYADTPIVTIANWNWGSGCVDYVYGDWDVERVTRDTLPGEWITSWPVESLRAGAVLIRGTVHHFQRNPEFNYVPRCNNSVPFFHLRNSRIQGWQAGRGAVMGNVNNQTNNRVTDTGPQVVLQNGAYNHLEWGACEQYRSRDIANQGWLYDRIITDRNGIYNGGTYYGYTCHNYATNSTLTIGNATYSYVRSLTNHTNHVRGVNWGYQTDTITAVRNYRQAEHYWGTTHIDEIRDAFGYSAVFAHGWHEGDAVEYRMYVGGTYSRLSLKGIADRPGPVTVNIYVDGYYKGQMSWSQNNNQNLWINNLFSSIVYDAHLVAVEFADDERTGPGVDQDRNLYIDTLYVGTN